MEVRTGLPSWGVGWGGRKACIWMPSGSEQTPRGHSGKCLRANQTLPEITTKPLKPMSEEEECVGVGSQTWEEEGKGKPSPASNSVDTPLRRE